MFLDDVVCWHESDRRSRSHLDLTAAIKLQYRISRFRDSCGYYSLTSPTLDPRNYEMDWDQRSRSNLDLMAQIKSWFHISWFWEVREPRSFDSPVSEMLICVHVSCLKMDGPPSFGILWALYSLHFKEHAGSPRSNGGRTLCSDLTPEIYPPYLRSPLVYIEIWRSSGIWDEIQRSSTLLLQAYTSFLLGIISKCQRPQPLICLWS